ncbi:MAG: UDP-N-acetylmuramate--L-alanine ligase [Planctomycetota bacterium]|nr:UDP-N-acetylmuramate--L-alanine ligase [Planctomycetota bacterium]
MAERVLIVGVGRSGRAAAALLASRGCDVRFTDARAERSVLPDALRHLRWYGAEPQARDLEDVDTLLLSPGVPLDAPVVHRARRAGLRITGEVEEAFRLSRVPVAAITGTNGKSTTTSLVSWILEQQEMNAPAGGNLGTPYSELVALHPEADVHVVEVSSFQAETLETFRPRVAALLNLSPDHLDRHGTLDAYAAAKSRVFARMTAADTIVLGAGEVMAPHLSGLASRRSLFGVGPASLGAWEDGGTLRVVADGQVQVAGRLDDISLPGSHHRLNVLAALAVAAPFGFDPRRVPAALRRFRGLAHRMAGVGHLRGIACFDDSKATNVEASVAGVGGLADPVVLLCGGQDDEQDFRRLAELGNVRLAFCFGAAGRRAAAAFGDRGRAVPHLEAAVRAAAAAAVTGDLIVLSPASKSFDCYRDFAERGRHFLQLVAELDAVKGADATHFVGIGGAGMSALAEALVRDGARVSGSDLEDGPVLARLRRLGVTCHVGHAAANIAGARCVVVSSAIPKQNPELCAAMEGDGEVIHRGDLLARIANERSAIAVTGSHGKTTTTGLVAHLLREGGKDPLALVGGDLVGEDGNVLYGRGEHVVCEADESDGSFARLRPEIAVVTNLDDEHLEHYGDFDGLARAVQRWIEGLPPTSRVCIGADDVRLRAAMAGLGRRLVTCGLSEDSVVRAYDLRPHSRGTWFRLATPQADLELDLPLPGEHNVANATLAIGAAMAAGLGAEVAGAGVASFRGIARRFEVKGEARGVLVVEDYAHHPTEIAAVIRAARAHKKRRILVVLQPHRHTRTRMLEGAFAASLDEADDVIVTGVYGADESRPADGGDHAIVEHLLRRGRVSARRIDAFDALVDLVVDEARPGDLVLLLTAGDLGRIAPLVLRRLGGPSVSEQASQQFPS